MNFHAPATAQPYEAIHGGTYTISEADLDHGRNRLGMVVTAPLDTLLCQGCDQPVVGNVCDNCDTLFLDLPVKDAGDQRAQVWA